MILIHADTDRPIRIGDISLPMLIHGRRGSGASLATVVLAAEFVRAGRPVVWLCRRAEAVLRLRQELQLQASKAVAAGKRMTPSLRESIEDSRLVTMFGSAGFLAEACSKLRDWRDRVIFIKNAEEILTPDLWDMVSAVTPLVISGDAEAMLPTATKHHWASRMFFSPLGAERIAEPSYVGVLRHQNHHSRRVIVSDSLN